MAAAPPATATFAGEALEDADSSAPEVPFDLAQAPPPDTGLFLGFADPLAATIATARAARDREIASMVALQARNDERFALMVPWMRGQDPELDQAAAEALTLAYVAGTPAGEDPPRPRSDPLAADAVASLRPHRSGKTGPRRAAPNRARDRPR